MPDVNWTKDDEQYYWSIIGPGYPDLFLRAAYVIVKNYLTNGVVDDNCQRCKYDPKRGSHMRPRPDTPTSGISPPHCTINGPRST